MHDLAALAVVRAAALDGDGVRAKNQLEMAGIDLLSALDATGRPAGNPIWPRPHLEMSA